MKRLSSRAVAMRRIGVLFVVSTIMCNLVVSQADTAWRSNLNPQPDSAQLLIERSNSILYGRALEEYRVIVPGEEWDLMHTVFAVDSVLKGRSAPLGIANIYHRIPKPPIDDWMTDKPRPVFRSFRTHRAILLLCEEFPNADFYREFDKELMIRKYDIEQMNLRTAVDASPAYWLSSRQGVVHKEFPSRGGGYRGLYEQFFPTELEVQKYLSKTLKKD